MWCTEMWCDVTYVNRYIYIYIYILPQNTPIAVYDIDNIACSSLETLYEYIIDYTSI